jgi:hypothetical protein
MANHYYTSTSSLSKSNKKANTCYVKAKDLYNEVVLCKQKDIISPTLYKYFEKMCKKIIGMNTYPYIEDYEDCLMSALAYCCSSVKKFDPNITTNAFSFFTQVIKNASTLAWNKLYPRKYKNTIGFLGSSTNCTGFYSL